MSAAFLLAFFMGGPIFASQINVDIIRVDTISAVSDAGISFSSPVVFAANINLQMLGQNGFIVGQSSVTASSFFGDGSNLTGLNSSSTINTTSTQIFSGANTFYSTFTIASSGRAIIFSTSSANNIITISSSGLNFSPVLHTSSFTNIIDQSTSNTGFDCVMGSTITIATTGGDVQITFCGNGSGCSDRVSGSGVGFLQDGNFVNDMSTSVGVAWYDDPSGLASVDGIGPFTYLITPVSAGIHSYCLTSSMSSACSSNSLYGFFYVKEIK
jgi:hypothetical protein